MTFIMIIHDGVPKYLIFLLGVYRTKFEKGETIVRVGVTVCLCVYSVSPLANQHTNANSDDGKHTTIT